jgi:IrrE N-terminal-like domain
LSDRLGRVAADLAETRDLPLDLLGLCRELGVGFRVAAADGPRRGALMRRGAAWEVVLMRRDPHPAAISPQERFTIAHELGHYMLMHQMAFSPQRRADYWLGEDLCNQFASRLLIPDRLLNCLDEPKSAAELARAVIGVANSAGVTFEPAARAVASRLATPVAIGMFRLDPLPSTRRLGFRGWWVENRSWWGARGGRRLAVYTDHALAPVLQRMRAMRPGQTDTPELAGALSTRLRRRSGASASFSALLT